MVIPLSITDPETNTYRNQMEGPLLLLGRGGWAWEGRRMGQEPHFAENKIAAHP